MKRINRFVCIVFLVILTVQGIGFSNARALTDAALDAQAPHFPETGSHAKTDDRLTVDYSHMDQGYVMVKAKKSEKRMQLTVNHGSDSVHYEINGSGEYEIIPLQFGSGNYKFTLMIAQKKGSNRCGCAGTVTLNCRMPDENNCFLYPNQYVNYGADDPLVQTARDLCRGLTEPMEIAKAICGYVSRNFDYDWIKAGTIRSGRTKDLLPDIGKTWETKKGICQDLSAVTCAMLRSQGVPAKLVIGSADGNYHSWVVIIIDGKAKRFDPSLSAGSYKAERYY